MMNKAILIPFCIASLLTLPAQAATAKKSSPSPTPDPKLSPVVQQIASDLQISAAEVVRTSNEDLKRLHEKFFEKQGSPLFEAKKKAAAVQLKN